MDGKLRDFNQHLQSEAKKIYHDVKQKWDSKMQKELDYHRNKMAIWTNMLAIGYLFLLLAYLIAFDLPMDVVHWTVGIAKAIMYLLTESLSIFSTVSTKWDDSMELHIFGTILAIGLLILIYGIIALIIIALIGIVRDAWTDMWYGNEPQQEPYYRSAHIFGLLSAQGVIATILRVSLPPPFNFNFINWWLILFVLTLIIHRKLYS